MRGSFVLALVFLLGSSLSQASEIGPDNGILVLLGGAAELDQALIKTVIDLAGGPNESIVVIPTGEGLPNYDQTFRGVDVFKRAGAARVSVLHTYDRAVADSAEFVEPLRRARGVFFFGGSHALLAESYVGTRTHRELSALLDRGGVIAGTSSGAVIIASFLTRRVTDEPIGESLTGVKDRGFGFLRNVAIGPHLLVANRQFDLLNVISQNPEVLGIGLDEQTGIIVKQDTFEVIGRTYVAIYDNQRGIPPTGSFYFLAPGDTYDLSKRESYRPSGVRSPSSRVKKISGQ